MKTKPDEEYFDIVDDDDNVVGRELRSHVHKNRLKHRAVHIIVLNKQNQVYLQKRSMQKDQLPGRWTTSCSGHVDSGEDYYPAAVRELNEELGITLPTGMSLDFRFRHDACRETGWEFIRIYSVLWEGEVVPDPDEISEGRWLLPEEIDLWMDVDTHAFAPSFRLVWKLFRSEPAEQKQAI